MQKDVYTRNEVKDIISNAIEKERKNSTAYQAWNPGKNADERKSVETYICGALVALMYEF